VARGVVEDGVGGVVYLDAIALRVQKAMRTTNGIERLNGEFRRRSEDPRLLAKYAGSRAVAVWVDHQ
jgi:hypothetical protein